MCIVGLSWVVISNNGTLFANTVVVDFCNNVRVQTNFTPVVHPQATGLAKLGNTSNTKWDKK